MKETDKKLLFILFVSVVAFALSFFIYRAECCDSACYPNAICPAPYAWKMALRELPHLIPPIFCISLVISLFTFVFEKEKSKLKFMNRFLIVSIITAVLISLQIKIRRGIGDTFCGAGVTYERVIINPDTREIIKR